MSEQLDPNVAGLLEAGIDSLTKYNVVRFLFERGPFRGDATELAGQVGLRATPRVVEAVEELAAVGLLLVSLAADDPPAFVARVADAPREALGSLIALPADSPQFGVVMRRLAARSLDRVLRQHLGER